MAERIAYGVCPCRKWGIAPLEFNETRHFLKCTCGRNMYLDISDPREAGYRDKDKVEISLAKFDKKLLKEFGHK